MHLKVYKLSDKSLAKKGESPINILTAASPFFTSVELLPSPVYTGYLLGPRF
jgi:hypothetical protein